MVQEACFPGIIAIRKDIQIIGIAIGRKMFGNSYGNRYVGVDQK